MNLRRFRVLLPPSSYIALFVGIYFLANLPLILDAVNGGPLGRQADRLTFGRKLVLVCGLVAYGAYRAFAFHPMFRPGYRKWLETTPWTWRQPLPVGPIRPVWEDFAILAAMSAPAWYLGELDPPYGSVCLVLGGYLMVLALTFATSGAWGFQYAVWFVLGLAVRVWDEPTWAYSGAVFLALAIGLVGLGRSLKRWPWELPTETHPPRIDSLANQPQTLATTELGWPFDRLGPRRDAVPAPRSAISGFLTSLLAGWWLYALMGITDDFNGRSALGTLALIYGALFSTAFRLSRYLTGYASPLDLGGRFRRMRWIIPSYDQVFVTPIVALMSAGGLPFVLTRAGLPTDASIAIAFAMMLMALNLGGPDLLRWQLTAKHRVVPAISSGAKQKAGYIQVG